MSKPVPAIEATHGDEQASAFTFPCVFPIKVMGRTQDGFAQAVSEVVRRHAPDFDPAALEMRASREGNWLSVTASVNATSREQLDNLYRELVAHPMVKMVL
jgi:putative lipoic acid-binding regulatory protein